MSQLLSSYQSFSAQKKQGQGLNTSTVSSYHPKNYVVDGSQDIVNTLSDMRKGIRSNVVEKMTGYNKFFKENTKSQQPSFLKQQQQQEIQFNQQQQNLQNSYNMSPLRRSTQHNILNQSSSSKQVPTFNHLQRSIYDISSAKNSRLFNQSETQRQQNQQQQRQATNNSPSPKRSSAQRGIERLGNGNRQSLFQDLNQSYTSSSPAKKGAGQFKLNQNQMKADIDSLAIHGRNKRRQSPTRQHSSGKLINLHWGTPSKSQFESKFSKKYTNQIKETETQLFKKSLIDQYFESPTRKRPYTSNTVQYSKDPYSFTSPSSQKSLGLQNKLPIQNLTETKYLLQSATPEELRSLPSSYTQELTKLSVAIIAALKRTNFYESNKFY